MSCQTSTRGYQACGHTSLSDLARCLSGTAPRPTPDLTRCLSGTAHPASPGWKMEKWKMEISPIALNLTFNITTTLPQSNIHIQHHHHPPPIQHSHSTLPLPSPNPTFTFNITHSPGWRSMPDKALSRSLTRLLWPKA